MNVALITGASMGIGEEFARQLAARKENLLLVARSRGKLEALAAELARAHGIQAHVFACDLAKPGAAKEIADFVAAKGWGLSWLVNNAGFGDAGAFDAMPAERVTGSLMVNVVALTELCHLLLPALRKAPGGRIVNVASTAAFQPVGYFAVYAATKAYVLNFTEAIREELEAEGIRVLCLCPGPTDTPFAKNNAVNAAAFKGAETAASVVRRGIAASDADAALYVCQRRIAIFAQRFLPRFFVRKAAAAVARRMMNIKR
jgi:short-subunit dehydrogenase